MIIVLVLVAPQVLPFDFGNEPVNDQETVVVVCTASKGDLPLNIQWLFNGQHLKTGDGSVVLSSFKRNSQLSIESVSHKNQGNYTCIVRNDAGTVNHTAALYVNGISDL